MTLVSSWAASYRIAFIIFAWMGSQAILFVDGHSSGGTLPIKDYDFVSGPVLKVGVQKQASLSISSFNETFDFDLEPNKDLIYPGAVVEILNGPSEAPTVLPLEGAVYQGKVKRNGLPVGWARFVFSNTKPTDPIMDGVFTTPEGMYHVKQVESYRMSKRSVDIDLASPFSRPAYQQSSKHILIREPEVYLSEYADHPIRKEANNDSNPLQKRNIPKTCENLERGLEKRQEKTSNPTVGGCGFKGPEDNAIALAKYEEMLRQKFIAESSVQGKHLFSRAPAGCPTSKRILVMAAAADCTYVSTKGGASQALNAILANWNTATKLFESTFNVALALVKVSIEQTCTPNDVKNWNRECSSSYTISDRLSDFSRWRGTVKDDVGLWHLMTKCGTQPSVGIAWLSMLCAQEALQQPQSDGRTAYVSGTAVSSIVPIEWKVVAHEIGHNFGAVHDCVSSNCPCSNPSSCNCCPCSPSCNCNGQYIMHPLDSSVTDNFSPCTIDQICSTIPQKGTCLKDSLTIKTIQSSICGNGVKEANEQCDCGSPEDCANDPCCGSDCKLKPGKTCDDRNDACCENCLLKANGTVCRASSGFCDIEEKCDGKSADCPSDTFQTDGTSCVVNSTSAQCASGQCTSRDLQCKGRGIFQSVKACPAFISECQLFCEDVSGLCLQFNGVFVDGTPCGETGRCSKGACTGQNFFLEALGWYRRNLAIAIPVTVVIGGIIIMFIWSCCARVFRKRRERRHQRNQQQRASRGGQRPPGERQRVVSNNPNQQTLLQHQTLNPEWSIPTLRHADYQLREAQSGEFIPLQSMGQRRESQPLPPIPTDTQPPPPAYTTSHWVDPKEYNGF